MKSPLVLFAEGAAVFLRLVRQGQYALRRRSTIVRHGRTFAQGVCVTSVTGREEWVSEFDYETGWLRVR